MLIFCALGADEIADKNSRVEALLAALAAGDTEALGGLYALIKTDIYAFALSKLCNREDAEDITHDTFVQLYKYAPQYRPGGKPMAWIITIALNLIRRKCNRERPTLSFDEAIGDCSDYGEFARSVAESELLRQLLLTLAEEEREIITLHIVSGLKHREIAKLLGKPLSTVLSRYNRAMKKLQIRLQGKEENA